MTTARPDPPTSADLDTLPAARLDGLAAERVLGWRGTVTDGEVWCRPVPARDGRRQQ